MLRARYFRIKGRSVNKEVMAILEQHVIACRNFQRPAFDKPH